jgi:NADH-quinone oxidoreductase subunit J
LIADDSSRTWPLLIGISIFIILAVLLNRGEFWETEVSNHDSKLHFVGMALLTEYALPFELVGIYLLVALVGATYIAKHNE